MRVEIQLKPEWYECLLSHAAEESSAYVVLEQAAKHGGYRDAPATELAVSCDHDDAFELLKLAKWCCEPAVHEIKLAILSGKL
jgi:hypothetical protein